MLLLINIDKTCQMSPAMSNDGFLLRLLPINQPLGAADFEPSSLCGKNTLKPDDISVKFSFDCWNLSRLIISMCMQYHKSALATSYIEIRTRDDIELMQGAKVGTGVSGFRKDRADIFEDVHLCGSILRTV